MPLRRMKAMTTSIASAESISASSWFSRPGSPGALVSSVVSSSGMSGSAIGCGVPSGRRSRIACRTSPGSTRSGGRICVDELGEPGHEVACNLDADSDSITVTYGRKRLLNLPTQMQRDPIRSLGRVQRYV